MEFFDSKEEVIDFQLTPYGKMLYSQGKFNPKFYSFADNEILYNSSAANFSETQNATEQRILEETPYTKPTLRTFQTKEILLNNVLVGSKNSATEEFFYNSEISKMNSLGRTITNSDLGPKIKIYVFEGEISGTTNFFSSSVPTLQQFNKQPLQNIPQVDLNLTYKSSVINYLKPENVFHLDNRPGAHYKKDNFTDQIYTDLDSESSIRSTPFKDGGQIVILPQKILILIEEENTVNSFDNYEVEVFEIMDSINPQTGNYELRQLKFLKNIEDYELENTVMTEKEKTKKLENLLGSYMFQREGNRYHRLSDEAESDLEYNKEFGEKILQNEVNYYFDIFTDYDNSITTKTICEYVKNLRSRGFKLDLQIECPDDQMEDKHVFGTDIYASNIVDPQKC